MFKGMPEKNAKNMHSVYVKAEELFDKLRCIEDDYVVYSQIASMDIDKHIDNHFSDVKDWEINFQMIKDQKLKLKEIPEKR